MTKSTKLDQIPFTWPTFDSGTQFHQKLHFRKALIITFQIMYNLSGFAEVKISPLFLVVSFG